MINKVQAVGKEAVARLYSADYTRLKRWLSGAKIVVLPLGVAALCYWASQERSMQWSDGWNRYLLLGVLISQISMFFFALRFLRVFNIFDLRLSIVDSLKINMLAMFYHFFVPLSIGADITKFVKLRAVAPDRRPMVTAGGIVLDHIVGFAVLVTIAVVLFVAIQPLVIEVDTRSLVIIVALGIVAGAFAVTRRRVASSLPLIKESLRRLRGHKGDLVLAFGFSVITQFLLTAAVFAGGFGWGMDIGYWEIMFVLTGSFIFQSIPVSLVGIGAAEIAGAGFYMALGLPVSDAVLLVSLMYCYRILVAIIGGIWDLISPTGN
jgi:hypothetical protein